MTTHSLRRVAWVLLLLRGVDGAAKAHAQTPPPLRWGGDQSGGGPYIFERNGRLTGFEVDLAEYLAAKLGRTSQFVQGDWDKLPDLLTRRRDIDLILNGYEWAAKHRTTMAATLPYYVYRLRLLVRVDDTTIHDWADLPAANSAGRRKCVGALSESAASAYLQKEFGAQIDLREFKDITNVMDLVQKRQLLDATVQDQPIVEFYGPDFPQLRAVGAAVAPNYYVMYLRPDDHALRGQLDAALRDGVREGTLRRIYEKYHLWNADQEGLADLADKPWPPPPEEAQAPAESWRTQVLRFAGQLTVAAGWTVLLACSAMPLAIVIGIVVAVGRLYGPTWAARPLALYVELLRGTPLLFQLYAIFFLLPSAGIVIPPFWAGVFGLAINYSAYEAENYRAGLLAIPRGQLDAALALGMDRWTALRRIILPQAIRTVIPPVTNDFIALFKDTSVCSVISVTELAKRYDILYNSNRAFLLELTAMTACLYLLMSYPLSLLARKLERKG